MDPQEWQRLAVEVAAEAGAELDQIENDFWPEASDPSFRSFWPRIRAVSDRLRTAPAIDIENKLQLLGRVRQLTKRARDDQEGFYSEQSHHKQELLDRVEELRAQAVTSSKPDEVRSFRNDLNAMRQTVTDIQLPTRGDRKQVWDTWHSATQEVWEHLSGLWASNEGELSGFLDQAQSQLDHGKPREARDSVRVFNSTVRDREVSHKAGRALRTRANDLWHQADELAKVKHETFMATAPQRVERWKHVKGRNASAINRLRVEIGELEENINAGGVAAAFARAMIDDKLRELAKLESTNDSLEERIEDVEASLTPA